MFNLYNAYVLGQKYNIHKPALGFSAAATVFPALLWSFFLPWSLGSHMTGPVPALGLPKGDRDSVYTLPAGLCWHRVCLRHIPGLGVGGRAGRVVCVHACEEGRVEGRNTCDSVKSRPCWVLNITVLLNNLITKHNIMGLPRTRLPAYPRL